MESFCKERELMQKKADKNISHFCKIYIMIYNVGKGVTYMKKSVISIALIMLLLFAGCGKTEKTEETSSTLPVVENTTISESTTISDKEKSESETTVKQNSNSETTTKPAEQKSADQTTTKKVTTTQKQTTTKKQTTTQKVTTTQKQTTTKKVTTTEDDWDCNVDGHSCKVGPIGWVNSYDEAVEKAKNYIDQNADSGGYRVEHCFWCGKYTATITLD